jgi:phospholipase C
MHPRRSTVIVGLVAVAGLAAWSARPLAAIAGQQPDAAARVSTSTPIKHLVVIFQENVSFDHYFGTYPKVLNPVGEPAFTVKRSTPTVNGLSTALLTHNPNLSNPQRLSRAQALTCDQDHGYTAEQAAMDHGAVDRYVQNTSATTGTPKHPSTLGECLGGAPTPGNFAVMDYYDGNTVTALWNYAQRFAMSDNSFGTGYGPSTPGALEVSAGQPFGAICGPSSAVYHSPGACPAPGTVAALPGSPAPPGTGTVYSDADPYFDVCAKGTTVQMGGRNVGDLLSAQGLTWGWFQGGFASPGYVPGKPATDTLSAVCTGSHANIGGTMVTDYSAHHQPFEYYRSTANPKHLPPTSIAAIGHQDQANHQYDISDFFAAASSGNLPAVSYLKAPEYQDGHAGYSDPLDEQTFLVNTINSLQKLPTWTSTAVVVAYDDSDGWYDHVMPPVISESQTPLDVLTAPGQCAATTGQVPTGAGGVPEQARCGYGPRLPLLVLSPYSRQNFVDHSLTDQSSVVRFIEDNWNLGRLGGGSADALAGTLTSMLDVHRASSAHLILDPSTGRPAQR